MCIGNDMNNQFKVMTFNIWFDSMNREKRLISLINIINQNDPDVICLQEVVPDTYKYLVGKLPNYKYVYPNNLLSRYDCMILSRYKVEHAKEYKYDSMMDRKLYVVGIKYPIGLVEKNICVATSHFESVFKKYQINAVKVQQYLHAEEILSDLYDQNNQYDGIILCADTNIMSHEEIYFFNDWIDSWVQDGSKKDIEYTYDTKLNKNLRDRNITEIRSRIDRIVYNKSSKLVQTDYKLLKNESLFCIEASDHFGVMTTFIVL